MTRTIRHVDQTTYLVELCFEVRDPAPLESLSDDVMEAIDEHTPDVVVGAAASVSFDPPALEVDIEIKAPSPAELNRIMADVLAMLDERTGLRRLTSARYAQTSLRGSAAA